jgi:hypothetical protein
MLRHYCLAKKAVCQSLDATSDSAVGLSFFNSEGVTSKSVDNSMKLLLRIVRVIAIDRSRLQLINLIESVDDPAGIFGSILHRLAA